MKWEKIAQRELDFLKNCLVYEAFVDDFVKTFGTKHPDFLTIRKGMSYTHYFNKGSSTKLAEFVIKQLKENPGFMKQQFIESKKHFKNMFDFCNNIDDPINKDDKEILGLIKNYFRLYKKCYPSFLISIEAGPLEKESNEIRKAINTMAKIRLFARSSFNKTHKLSSILFDEIADRFDMSVYRLKFLTPPEIISLLKGKKFDIKQKIKDRQRCFFIHHDGTFRLAEDSTLKIHNGQGFDVKQLKGRGTFPAKYKGKVKLIKTKKDIQDLKGGEIIVLQMTTTDLITDSIKKAGAIITDEGGITCHAAILSREFRIPAVIGTKYATKILKNNQSVELDAEKGIIIL